MKFHDELNPKLWNKDKTLKDEVADKLEEIAEAFIEYLDIDLDAIKDVVITGSSASYNYTPHSDLDLHLKVDYDMVHEDCPIVEGFLWSMKSQFNKDHDINIYGIPVELYAESIDGDTVHNGLYSLMNAEWIDEPQKIPPTDNDDAVLAKYNEIKEAAEKIEDSEVAEELINKIYEMRKAGLADAGEFSTENLAFKKLRDEGVLERLKKMKKEKVDKQLSLESYNKSIKEEFFVGNDKYMIVPVSYTYSDIRILDKKTDEFLKNENGDILKFPTEEECGNYIKSLEESIKEDYEDDDYEDIPEEMHKERYVTYFETPEGRQKYTIYHVYTDSTDDSYNELCDKKDNQLGMYNSYKELKDAIKERAEKIAKQQGWTVKSIENLGEDEEYYRERNKWESIKKSNKNESVENKQEIISQIKTILKKYGYKIDEIVPYGLSKGLWYCLDDQHAAHREDTDATYIQGKNYTEILKKIKTRFSESLKTNKRLVEVLNYKEPYETDEEINGFRLCSFFGYHFANAVYAEEKETGKTVGWDQYENELYLEGPNMETKRYELTRQDELTANVEEVKNMLPTILADGSIENFPVSQFLDKIKQIDDDILTNYPIYWDRNHEGHRAPTNNSLTEATNNLVQCVIKIMDTGNSNQYLGIIEDASNYVSQYDVDVEYEDRKEDEDPTIDYVIAYHKDGEKEFFDEFGQPLDLDFTKDDEFNNAIQNADNSKDLTVIPDIDMLESTVKLIQFSDIINYKKTLIE